MTAARDDLAALPNEIQVWRNRDTLDHIGTWATTRYPPEAVTYVRKADAQAAVALVVPVTWKYRWKIDGEYVGWRYSDASNFHLSLDGYQEEPLYSARALLDARAENTRLRADAQAAVALALEAAAATCENIPNTLVTPNQRLVFGQVAARIRALAPADGLAAVAVLRKELADTQTQLGDWIVRADEANVRAEKAEADLAAVEAALRQIVESDDMAADLFTNDGDRADNFADRARAALSNNGRGE